MSADTQPSQPSVGERRGHQVPPLQMNFSRPTSQIINVASPLSQRPRPSDYEDIREERVPLQAEPVKRQSSRTSFRHIFSREKHARKAADPRLSGIQEVQDLATGAPVEEAAPLSPMSGDCDTPRAPAASTPTPAMPSQSANTPRGKLQPRQRSKTDGDEQLPAEDTAWKPPPLFKAYPQGLKHAILPAPTLSSDSIMRLHATFKARGASLNDDKQGSQPANEELSEEQTARKKKIDKENQKYLRALSDNIDKGEWTQKVFVIATSGYILQYAGDGKHDRVPEKMLLLGPKSVAFASDAIPGKHWVLQVSQGSEEDSGTNAETPRPLFSRFGFHRSYARRLARNLLLVFNDPEEMSSWLLTVRAQIEARGGKKYVTEKVYDEGMESQLRTTPSMRQMVKKDPNRFSAVYLQPRPSMNFDDKDSSAGDQSRRSSYISANRRSLVMNPTPESRSGSVSTAHTEAVSNPEEPTRFYAAVGSPPLQPSSVISDSASTSTAPRKRRSMVMSPSARSEAAEIPRAQSTVPDGQFRSASPPAPNFSVPLFSRRFAARPDVPHVPHLPSVYADSQRDDSSIDAVSMFSSPPQSPNRDGFGMPIDSHEQRRPVDRREHIKKTLRTSTSEDALGVAPRDPRDRSRLRYSQLPEHITMMPEPTSPPRTVKPATSHQNMPLAEVVNTPGRRDPHQSRSDPPSRPSSVAMSRRKSLGGLTAGPPTGPPPSIPLPKLPTTFADSSPVRTPVQSPPLSPVDKGFSNTPQSIRSVGSRNSRHISRSVQPDLNFI
ncbi:hypothetical protein BDV18DRAFT_42708 [Aspergillus unguis]